MILVFPPERVNTFMSATFDYMLTTTDMALGDPDDHYRLVQKWAWYSTGHLVLNGSLFDLITFEPSAMGQNHIDYVSTLPNEDDLYPVRIFTDPLVPLTEGNPVTLTLKARVASAGSLQRPLQDVTVQFFDGDPDNGGTQIGDTQMVSLSGCGDHQETSVTWTNIPPGGHEVYVVVDNANVIAEMDEENNVASTLVVVATEQIFLPAVLQAPGSG